MRNWTLYWKAREPSADDIKRNIIKDKLAKFNDSETASALIGHVFGRELFRRLCVFTSKEKNNAVSKE